MRVVAIDGDSNPNLGPTIGVPKADFDAGVPLAHDVIDHKKVNGKVVTSLAEPLETVLEKYAIQASDGIRLLTLDRPESAGGG